MFKWLAKIGGPELRQELQQVQEEPVRHYLDPTTPVVEGLASFEISFGGAEYRTLRSLRSRRSDGRVMVRYTPSDQCREAIAKGADLYLELLTFGKPLQPILLSAATELDPSEIAEEYGLTPESRNNGS